jgi:hypothetical protein
MSTTAERRMRRYQPEIQILPSNRDEEEVISLVV